MIRILTRSLIVFPPFLLGSLYATWYAAWLALGRSPRAYFDDPKGIQGEFMWIYDLTVCLMVFGTPLFCLAWLLLGLSCLEKRPLGWKVRLSELAVSLGLFIALLVFCDWDPHSVTEWFFD